MRDNTTKSSTRDVPPDPRWIEFFSSVTIEIPKKWDDEAKPFACGGCTLWVDMMRYMNRISESLYNGIDGCVTPHIFIKSMPFLSSPALQCEFWKEGIPVIEDGEPTKEGIIPSEELKSKLRMYAAKYFIPKVIEYRNEWMAKYEAIKQEGKVYEYA